MSVAGGRKARCRARRSIAGARRIRMVRSFAVLIAAGCLLTAQVSAQENWPQRQVNIVVPFAAGGSADLIGRILQQQMQARFSVPFVVENKSGAGGSIGAAYAAKSP